MENPTHMYLYGAGGHAKVVAGILTSRGVRVAGVFDDNPPAAKLRIMEVRDGVQLLGGAFPKLDAPMIITIGHNGRRAELAALIDASFGTAIHPSAIIASGGISSSIPPPASTTTTCSATSSTSRRTPPCCKTSSAAGSAPRMPPNPASPSTPNTRPAPAAPSWARLTRPQHPPARPGRTR